jgi:Transposase DDE domain group 1
MTSEAGILLLAAVERQVGIADQLAACIVGDLRAPERVWHTLAEIIHYRAPLIGVGYPDGKDCTARRDETRCFRPFPIPRRTRKVGPDALRASPFPRLTVVSFDAAVVCRNSPMRRLCFANGTA